MDTSLLPVWFIIALIVVTLVSWIGWIFSLVALSRIWTYTELQTKLTQDILKEMRKLNRFLVRDQGKSEA